jgi:hypothetical protein
MYPWYNNNKNKLKIQREHMTSGTLLKDQTYKSWAQKKKKYKIKV